MTVAAVCVSSPRNDEATAANMARFGSPLVPLGEPAGIRLSERPSRVAGETLKGNDPLALGAVSLDNTHSSSATVRSGRASKPCPASQPPTLPALDKNVKVVERLDPFSARAAAGRDGPSGVPQTGGNAAAEMPSPGLARNLSPLCDPVFPSGGDFIQYRIGREAAYAECHGERVDYSPKIDLGDRWMRFIRLDHAPNIRRIATQLCE